VLDVMRAITGSSDFDDVTAQASQFRQGHYLTRHLDDVTGEQRKYAFVVGLTQAWHPDWRLAAVLHQTGQAHRFIQPRLQHAGFV